MPTTLLWLRQDLRLKDHPALVAAVARGAVLPVYILDDAENIGSASLWWLHHSLDRLAKAFMQYGIPLILRRGKPLQILQQLVAAAQADAVFWTRRYEPRAIAQDTHIKEVLQKQGIRVEITGGSMLFEPETVCTKQGGYFKVFTAFWKHCMGHCEVGKTLPIPEKLVAPKHIPASECLAEWKLLPTKPDWSGGLAERWQPGEAGADERLHQFLEGGLRYYQDARDIPAKPMTSYLSPSLHYGEISPRALFRSVEWAAHMASEKTPHRHVECFLKELGWREFSYYLLYHFPQLPDAPFLPAFSHFPWQEDADALRRWQRGKTGYPLVDAGMRELWHTGYMHNRVRMVVASFLTKDLLLPWQQGAAWFWDTLVDADLANNSASWQWVAGCGADAAPYFRIFNPVTQSERFDPEGDYIRRWVPELSKLSARTIHAPWQHHASVKGYPEPMVDHSNARDKALAAYDKVRRGRS